jgi:hypothetical protein
MHKLLGPVGTTALPAKGNTLAHRRGKGNKTTAQPGKSTARDATGPKLRKMGGLGRLDGKQ